MTVTSTWRHRLGTLLRARPGGAPTTVTVRAGVAAGLRLGTADASADYRDGTNELPVQQAVRDLLRPGHVFFDVGSNIGFFALLASREVGPSGEVHAFEPVPRIADAVRRNAALNEMTNVRVHTVAVADADGSADLVLAGHPGGATLSAQDVPPDATGVARVKVVTLDRLVGDGTVPLPDVVKIDVEGAEMQVLDGMAQLLRTRRPSLVCELDSADPHVLAEKIRVWRARMLTLDYEVQDLAASYEGSGWHVYHATARPSAPRSAPGQGSSA